MGTPKEGYYTKDGARVPSVTTILGRFKDSGALIKWAWKMGMEGKNFEEIRDKAATAGTLAHEMVEDWLRGKTDCRDNFVNADPSVAEKATRAFNNFLEWARQSQLRVTHTEVRLVSERYRFGGTLDGILVLSRRTVGDWKTSNAIYADYLMQVAAYRLLWNENYPDDQSEDGVHIVRFAKEYGDFEHRYFSGVLEAETAFLDLRKAYESVKVIEKRVK